MPNSRASMLLLVLCSCPVVSFAEQTERPKLPDQYAEAVLQVEGMI